LAFSLNNSGGITIFYKVGVSKKTKYHKFGIKDTGFGMSEEEQEK
jgi:hypothetical protein